MGLVDEHMWTARFSPWISLRAAEEFLQTLEQWSSEDASLTVDLTETASLDSGVGWRIGNAISQFRDRSEGNVTVLIPGRGNAGTFGSELWFTVYIRSGLGMSIAHYASRVLSNSIDVTNEFREYFGDMVFRPSVAKNLTYYVQDSSFQSWIESARDIQLANNAVMTRNLSGSHMRLYDLASFYQAHMAPYWRHMNATSDAWKSQDIASIAEMCWEACRNVVEHADRFPEGKAREILSYIGFRYYRSLSGSEMAVGGVKRYLDSLVVNGAQFRRDTPFIEVTINDDGIGIPARQSGHMGIYLDQHGIERDYLSKALEPGISTKPFTLDVPSVTARGYGYLRIHKALKGLTAYAVLRTGRTLASFDGTRSDQDTFKVQPETLGYMPGTTLSILIPIPDPQLQTRLPL